MEYKKYDIPEEMHDLMLDYQSALKCRDRSIESLFKAKRAIYYGKEAEKARHKFWNMVSELYPNVDTSTLVYVFDGRELRLKDETKP